MKQLKCCKIKIIGLLIGLFSSSSTIATETLEGPLACDFSAEESRMVTLKITNGDIEGAVMRLPRDYITGVGYSENSVNDSALLRAYNTNFRPYPNRELHLKDGRSKTSVGINDKVNILISSNWRPEILAKRTISSQYKYLRFNDPNTDIEGKLAEHGLYKPNHEIKSIYGMEVSLGKRKGIITDVISCSQDLEIFASPQCSHLFEAGAYDVKISYAKTQLSRWKELRQNTDKLLQCFTVQEPKQIEGK